MRDQKANRFLTTDLRSIVTYKLCVINAYQTDSHTREEMSVFTFAITFMVREIRGLKDPIFGETVRNSAKLFDETVRKRCGLSLTTARLYAKGSAI